MRVLLQSSVTKFRKSKFQLPPEIHARPWTARSILSDSSPAPVRQSRSYSGSDVACGPAPGARTPGSPQFVRDKHRVVGANLFGLLVWNVVVCQSVYQKNRHAACDQRALGRGCQIEPREGFKPEQQSGEVRSIPSLTACTDNYSQSLRKAKRPGSQPVRRRIQQARARNDG